MNALITPREAYALEAKADMELCRIVGRMQALRAEQDKWRNLSYAARAMQDYLNGEEGFEAAPEELDEALDDLGLARPAESYIPAGAL